MSRSIILLNPPQKKGGGVGKEGGEPLVLFPHPIILNLSPASPPEKPKFLSTKVGFTYDGEKERVENF